MRQPPSDRVFFLVEDGELVFALGKDDIDADLVFAHKLGLDARMVVEAGEGIVHKLFSLRTAVHALKYRFELCGCRKLEA